MFFSEVDSVSLTPEETIQSDKLFSQLLRKVNCREKHSIGGIDAFSSGI